MSYIAFNLAYKKNKLCYSLNYWSKNMFKFVFFRKSSRNSFSTHILGIIFQERYFHVISINRPKSIVSLPLLLKILDNICNAIVCCPGCDVINFEISLIFLIKQFFYLAKNLRQKFKYLENEKSFQGETKSTFYHFWRSFSCKKLSQAW